MLVVAACVTLIVAIALPLLTVLSKSVLDTEGRFIGLANYIRYVTTPALVQSLLNSLFVAVVATAIVIPLGFLYAYALTRSRIPAKGLFYALALLPIFAPSLLPALSLIALFGTSIYGPIGIVLAQIVHCLPHATMILVAALGLADGRLYEVATSLGTSRWRVFVTVTLPAARYGLVSAAVVVFTLVVTDFGIAKVIGGPFEVLATEAYRQMVGQRNVGMGAVVGVVLLVPAGLAFLIDRRLRRLQVAPLSARAVPYVPPVNELRDRLLLGYCLAVGGLMAAVLGAAVWVSLIRDWPRDPSLTLAHFDLTALDPDGWGPYVNSLWMATLTALFGTPLVFLGAYVMEKTRAAPRARALARFLALLPMAVPGVVLGLGYVFFFGAAWNPAGGLSGTIAILALSCIAQFYTVAHVTAVTALTQIDGEFEAASASLQVPFWVTLREVTVPICLPAILDITVYLFVNAMTTVAAVIFLYGPGTRLAAIAVVQMDEAGAIAGATAMATCIVATCLGVKLLHLLLDALVFRRRQRWRGR
nr:putative 2-aminoethylphosphonate ABC transporter permease subunit [Neoroseomonas alba]